jgi:hypothetical protein
MLPSLLQSGNFPFPVALFPFITFTIYAYGIWSGFEVIRGKPGWQRRSMWFWLTQSPAFSSTLVSFSISCGFGAWIYLRIEPSGFGAGWAAYAGSGMRWSYGQADQPLTLGLNTFAVMLAVLLFGASRRTPQQPRAEA